MLPLFLQDDWGGGPIWCPLPQILSIVCSWSTDFSPLAQTCQSKTAHNIFSVFLASGPATHLKPGRVSVFTDTCSREEKNVSTKACACCHVSWWMRLLRETRKLELLPALNNVVMDDKYPYKCFYPLPWCFAFGGPWWEDRFAIISGSKTGLTFLCFQHQRCSTPEEKQAIPSLWTGGRWGWQRTSFCEAGYSSTALLFAYSSSNFHLQNERWIIFSC